MKINERVGEIQEVFFEDEDEDEDGSPHDDIVRVRVIVNLERCLIPAIRLKKENCWVHIKDEKLQAFCKFRGLITHDEDDCNMIYKLADTPPQFSEWAIMPVPTMENHLIHYPFGD